MSRLLAAHPGLTLLADDRELLAALIYYVRPHPFGAVEWNPIPGITDQYRLVNNIGDHRGEDFLAVTVHDLFDEMRPEFAELIPLTTIRTRTGREWRDDLRRVDRARIQRRWKAAAAALSAAPSPHGSRR